MFARGKRRRRTLVLVLVLAMFVANFSGTTQFAKAAPDENGSTGSGNGAEIIAEWTSFRAEDGRTGSHLATGGVYQAAGILKALGGPSYEAVSNSSTEKSVQYQGWDKGSFSKYWLVEVPVKGFQHITVSSKQKSSGSGPADFELQYSTDGVEWLDAGAVPLKLVNGTYAVTAQIMDHALNQLTADSDMLYLRWIVASTVPTNPSNAEVGGAGSSYISQIQIKGERIDDTPLSEPLTVLYTDPAQLTENIKLTAPIAVTFNLPIELTSVLPDIKNDQGTVLSGVQAEIDAADNRKLNIIAADLAYSQSYTVTLPKAMVRSTAGGEMFKDFSWTFHTETSPYKPKLMTMSFNGDTKTSIGFAWYTDTMTGTIAEVVEADRMQGGVFPAAEATVFEGSEEQVDTYMVASDRQTDTRTTYISHKVTADGLKPGTTYRYRLGNGEAGSWSPVGSFTTDAKGNEPYHFIVGADSQASSLSAFEPWGDTFRKAVDFIGDPRFLIVAGDLVDNGDLETQWQWMLQTAEDSLLHVPYVPVLGGHEVNDYDGDVTTDNNNFFHHFNVPRQVVEGTHEGSVYSFEYGDALYMVFNSQFEGGLEANGRDIAWEDPEFRAQLDWMRNTVARSDKKWKFVTFHKSPYASGDNSALYEDERVQFYRQHLIPVFDELGIDMVFEAHDHMYMRSFQMFGNEVVPPSELVLDENGFAVNPKGTVYLMPNALGNKFYTKQQYLYEFDENWNPVIKLDEFGNPVLYDHFFAEINEQPHKKMFTDVAISEQVLSFKSYTAAVEDENKSGTIGKGLMEYDSYGIKRTDGIPAKPIEAKVSMDGSAAILEWAAPFDSSEPIRGYRIYEKNDKVAVHWSEYMPSEQNKNSYSLTVSNLNPAKNYEFVIKAVGARINSEPVVVATKEGGMGVEPPSAPTDLKARVISQHQIVVTWKAPAGTDEIAGYHIYRDGVKIADTAAGVYEYADFGLNPGTTYRYFIKAVNSGELESEKSSEAVAVTVSAPAGNEPHKPFPQHTAYAGGSIKPNHITQEAMDNTVIRLYKEWKEKYLKDNPYEAGQKYVWYSDASWYEEETDEDTGLTYMPITVSEAHGYGMMILAIMAGQDEEARDDYDAMFRYFRAHPSEIHPELMAWQQGDTGTAIIDINGADSATDGDMDIAYSLLLAHSQWGSGGSIDYLAEARKLIAAIMNAEVNPSNWTLRIADWATSGKWANATRPSDWMLQHMKDYELATGDSRWNKVVDGTYAVMDELFAGYSSASGLLPDFVIRENGKYKPAPEGFLEGEYDGQYNYNSARTPWRIGTDFLISGDKRPLAQLEVMNKWIRQMTGDNPANIKGGYELDGSAALNEWEDLTFSAPFMVGAMIDKKNQDWLNKLWDYNASHITENEVYFSNNIRLLSMIVASGNWWSPAITDYEAPEAPVIDFANPLSSTAVELKWLPAKDNVGVLGYKVFRDGTEIATVYATTFQDKGLTPGHQYSYLVIAFDAAGNESKASNMRLVTLPKSTNPLLPQEPEKPGKDDEQAGEEGENGSNEPRFTDIADHWATLWIENAAKQGWFSGYPDGTFRPNGNITREQFAVVIAKLLPESKGKGKLNFTDGDAIGNWAEKAIEQAVTAGIIKGYPDGSFRPKAYISRAEMALMMERIIHLQVSDLIDRQSSANSEFSDQTIIPAWALLAVKAMAEYGLMDGKDNGRFAPADKATRAESAKVILQLAALINEKK